MVFLPGGCRKSGSGSNIPQMLQQGTWFVHYFYYNGSDQTNLFTPFTFTFSSSGSVTAAASGNPETGTWQYSGNTLTLLFTSADKFQDLNDTWTITGNSGDLITMTGTGGNQLHFKKS